jgi:hypothetical protein
MKRILEAYFILSVGRKGGVILVLFVPLHGQCQYDVVAESHGVAHPDELAEILDILETQILRKV